MSLEWIWFLGGIAAGIAAYKILAKLLATQMIIRIEKKHLHWVLSDQLIRHEETLKLPDGTQLQGYIYEADVTPAKAPAVLFLHGMGGFAQDFNCEPMLSALASGGYRVFAYDFRASGRSRKPKEPTIFGSLSPTFINQIYDDPKAALDWVLTHKSVDPDHVVVIGVSLGASMALSGVLHDPRVKMIIGICAPHDLSENIKKSILEGPFMVRFIFKLVYRRLWKQKVGDRLMIDAILDAFHQVSPISQIRADFDYTNRVFLVHSKVDEVLPFAINYTPNVTKMHLPLEQIFIVERGGHELNGQGGAIMSRVNYWLKKYL